jgi:Ca2+-binding RTX toxin-like protein
MANTVPAGPEFLINTTIQFTQNNPTITALSDGRFVVSWSDNSRSIDDPYYTAIRAQIIHADGTMDGGEFLVNTTTIGVQNHPDITALAGGKFLITWSGPAFVGDNYSDILGQVFDKNGTPIGSELHINTTVDDIQNDSSVAGLNDGGFVVVWEARDRLANTASSADILGQMYNADGSPKGSEFTVNTITEDWQSIPDVTSLSNGGFVVSWQDTRWPTTSDQGTLIRMQIFDAAGTAVGGEIIAAPTTQGTQTQSSITDIGGGKFVVTWQEAEASSSFHHDIFARVFSNDGTAFSSVITVDSTADLNEYSPSVTGLADGRFVISWNDQRLEANGFPVADIQATVFNADGSPASNIFPGNSDRSTPDLATLADNRIVVTWADQSLTLGDNSDQAIHAQFFDLRTGGVNFSGNTSAEEYVGTDFVDKLSGHRGNDFLSGMGGNDRLIGGSGHDRLAGGDGDDLLAGGQGRDFLQGDAGNDQLLGHQLADTLYGGLGDDRLNGGSGIDRLYGGDGIDRLLGGKGNDHLFGGQGKDVMRGQLGADVFHFEDAGETGTSISQRDVILDFATGKDKIDLGNIDAGSAAGDQAFAFVGGTQFSHTEGELRYKTTAVRTVIQADIDGDGIADFEIGLQGVITLSSDDFIL